MSQRTYLRLIFQDVAAPRVGCKVAVLEHVEALIDYFDGYKAATW